MEDLFEFLIYIVLGVLGLAGNMYRNYNKKKEEQRRKARAARRQEEAPEEVIEPEKPAAEPFPDFETIFGIPEQTRKFEHIEEEEEEFDEEEDDLAISNEDLPAEKEEEIEEEEEDVILQIIEEKEPFEFDAKQAIIYSEIMNRREY